MKEASKIRSNYYIFKLSTTKPTANIRIRRSKDRILQSFFPNLVVRKCLKYNVA